MKIALVNLGRIGAGPLYALEIAKRLASRCELLSLISRQAYNLPRWRESGLRLIETDTYSGPLSFLAGTLDVRRHVRIRRELRRFQPDAIYYPMIHPWYPIVGLLNPSVPSVLTLHDPVLHEGEKSLAVEALQRMTTSQAERVIVLSRIFVELLARRGFSSERVDVIPLGEMSYYDTIAKRPRQVEQGPPTLLFIGRILPYKGLDTLLAAFPLVRGAVPDAQLLVLGDGDVRPHRAKLAALSGVTLDNRWVPDDQIAEYLRRADVVVVPHHSATQSLAVPAAYAFGKPVVATAVGGIPEQVVHEQTGLLVPPRQPEALASACVRLLRDPAWAKQMGEAGHNLARARWNWDTVAERVYLSCRAASAARFSRRELSRGASTADDGKPKH
jgi:glycosyltransferase involved in cell wall biosynthesis